MSAPYQMRVMVTRGERFDVAEWVIDDGEPVPDARALVPGVASKVNPVFFAGIAGVVVVLGTFLLLKGQRAATYSQPLTPTVADLAAIHAGVAAGKNDVRALRRLAVGEVIETDADGRARLRLDDGTAFVIDRKTKLSVEAKGIKLLHGRVFVLGAPGARTEIDVGGATAILNGAQAGIERPEGRPANAKLYAASGEITVRAGGADHPTREGETASLEGDKVTVAPEKGFDDWTGGMAAPWGASGPPRRAVGELWGRSLSAGTANPGEASSPLTIRAHDVRATITREIAETEVSTTFFNGGSETVTGDYRMAIPPGAIVSRFASVRGQSVSNGRIALAARGRSALMASGEVLEWAGEGWLRGTIPAIAPGSTVTVVVGYVEWLSPRDSGSGKTMVAQYRYPMAGAAAPPLIGEFSARVDAAPSEPVALASGLAASVSGQAVVLRRPDFRPTADLVVDVEFPTYKAPARLYSASPGDDDDAGATVLVRTEVPAASREDGVTLALVIDSSSSIEPSLLDAERAVVEAVLLGLGARDRAIVLAADQTVRPLGPATIGPVDAARRKAIQDALSTLAPGGATDLGRALEAGADALPADAPAAMVIYVGDGWPTIGDMRAPDIQARLARRPGGPPRLGAVGVGPLVNRFALAGLVSGSGPLFEVADTTDAAKTAVSLIAEALSPTIAGVEIRFGPEVERIYPRTARAVPAGHTAFAVGRARGDLPKEVTLVWRDAKGTHEERRQVTLEKAANEADVARRWAAARVEEIALRGKGREAATDVALRAGLLTPWTGWLAGGATAYVPTTLQTRILDLASGPDVTFSADFATPRGSYGTLTDVPQEADDGDDDDDKDDALKSAISEAAERVIDDAGPAVRACRDSRAQLRPELSGSLDVGLKLDGEGRAGDVRVRGTPGSDDDALDRCVKVVVEGLVFPQSGIKVTVEVKHRIELPPARTTLRGRKCSATATLPLPLRRGVWQERLLRGAAWDVYLEAKQSCELPTWTDRRTLLELVLGQREEGMWRVQVAQQLERAGDSDAASLLRREAVRRAKTPDELRDIKVALVGAERYPLGVFKKQYRAAGGDRERLSVVRRFLGIAPHDTKLRRRLLSLLEALGMKSEVGEEVRRVRLDPFADATLLAEGASALRRIGAEEESRRAFGELVERAPSDPWARAFLGDRLRNEGLFDDATRAYAVLEDRMPDEPATLLRLALGHAGAGRLDIASRMLSRLAQTGGRAGDAQLGELAGRLAEVLLAEARGREGLAPAEKDRLLRASLELPHPTGATTLLVRAPSGALALDARLVRGLKDARDEHGPEIAAPGLGLYALRVEPDDGTEVVLRLRRPEELAPARATRVRVDALVPDGRGKPPKLVSTEVELPITGKAVELRWIKGAWSSG